MLWRAILIVISGPCGDKIGHGIFWGGGERLAGRGFERGPDRRVWGIGEQTVCRVVGMVRSRWAGLRGGFRATGLP